LANFILDSQAIAKSSDYLFDPGIGQLVKLWGFHGDDFTPALPAPAALESLRVTQPSIRQLHVVDQHVSSTNKAVAIDFGGYLKGVALDRAAMILHQQGVHHALINIGGNVMALGNKQGRPWRVGIQHPRQPGPLATIALADGEAIGTSGDYQRYFELAGQRYPHLIDPRDGYPAKHTQAVTVVLPAGTRAGSLSDALSKPIFIAGPHAWRAMARQLQVAWVLRVDQNGQIEVTEALSRRLKLAGSQPAFQVIP
jgi:thiamine biosynthesis lipoprotein